MSDRTTNISAKRGWALAGAIAAACAAPTALAADWSFDPRITLNAQADDNNRLTSTPGQEAEVSGAEYDLQFAVQGATPRSTFRLVPRARGTMYPSDEDEETNAQFLRAAYEFRGQRSEAVIDGEYSRRETLGRYLPDDIDDPDLGEPNPGDDLGNTGDRNVQRRFLTTPSVSFDVTERSAIEFGANYLDVTYDEQVNDDREDYYNVGGDVGYRFDVSPTKSITLRARVGQYNPEDDIATDSQVLELEWGNRVSETSRVYFRAGSNRVEEFDALGGSTWNTGFTGGGGVLWSFEVTDLFLDFVHGLDPNSSGRLVESDEVRFRLTRRLSEVTTLLLSARGTRDGKTNDQDIFQERKYAVATAGFQWRFTQQFALGGGYEYTWRDIEGDAQSAESNLIFLGVTWEPHRL